MSTIDVDDTIVAIASPTSPAVRGIVRLSGSDVTSVLQRMGIGCQSIRTPHRYEAQLPLEPPLGVISVAVLLWPTGRSYTGQPSAEIHTHGSLPVLSAVVESAVAVGARAARGGEFTMRAFLAGRLDLTQAEAVLGVIEAEQRGSLDRALSQLAGNLSKPLEQIRHTVLDLLADVEAGLDFVDEDIEFIGQENLIAQLQQLQQQIALIWETMEARGGEKGVQVITVRGEPNAGKSYLINRLSDSESAIVADLAGTTRDTVITDAQIHGKAVQLIDTAGIEIIDTDISRQAQQQAERASQDAAIRLWCVDSSRDDFDAAAERLSSKANQQRCGSVVDLWVATKCDLSTADRSGSGSFDWVACSATTGEGVDRLCERISEALELHDREEIGSVVGTAARCRQSVRRAESAVVAAIQLARHGQGDEFIAAELRQLADSLGEVTGAVYTDDILDRVFGRFCIGK